MINGFEKITEPLTQYELDVILPQVIIGLKGKRGKSNAITNREMREGLYNHKILTQKGKKISEVTLRKIIHHIRVNDLVECLTANGRDGYFIEPLDDEVMKYIESLQQRNNANTQVQNALLRQVNRRRKQFDTPVKSTVVYKEMQEKIFTE